MQEKVKNKQKQTQKSIKKQEKGITLIALVITIIVLLILAGVSIATLTGENGILTRATDSKTETEIAGEKEAIQLAYAGAVAEKRGTGDITAEDLNREFETNETNATAEDGANGEITVTFDPPSNRVYTIDSNGNIIESGTDEPENPDEPEDPDVPPTSDEDMTLDEAKDDSMLKKDGNSTIKVEDGKVIVPEGFKIADDSGKTLDEGIVIEDKNHNQFVWTPVSQENFDTQFVRKGGWYQNMTQTIQSFGEANAEGVNSYLKESNTTVNEAKAMYKSVYDNEGFYMGRYEAGRDNVDNEKVVIRKGANAYTGVPWSANGSMIETTGTTGGAVELSRNFDTANEYTTVTSTLCYGVQWDAILKWIDPNYEEFAVRSSGKGHYNSANAITTGSNETYSTKKIYDLAGNIAELTMESYHENMRVIRGGYYQINGNDFPASSRYYGTPDQYAPYAGFRIALYLNN